MRNLVTLLSLVVVVGCGTSHTGGVAVGGAGGEAGVAPTGGAATGGASTGGAATGGAATGGAATGGAATGGAPTGGAGGAPDPACAAVDGNGFFADCTVCLEPGNCDGVDVGTGVRQACGCTTGADCPCGLSCDCYEIVPGVNVCGICVR